MSSFNIYRDGNLIGVQQGAHISIEEDALGYWLYEKEGMAFEMIDKLKDNRCEYEGHFYEARLE